MYPVATVSRRYCSHRSRYGMLGFPRFPGLLFVSSLALSVPVYTATPRGMGSMDTSRYTALILRLYTTRDAKEQEQIISENYAESATFEDPIMIVKGADKINTQFNSLLSFFSRITAEVSAPPDVSAVSAGGGSSTLLAIHNRQVYYREGSKVGPKEIPIDATTHLTIDPNTGRILAHHDVWHNHSFESPVKKASGMVSSAIFNLFGVGQDKS
eukprot:TRINITY_DN22264_c0_g1_i1.p1 TRINITY_DN22264_c0_g1~~TRINITY_DN22264_c0_g1_i1.p1  ORF type:complete len:213 (+),score=22.08 TRINITY_DN22264_c0_g1_i1:103-741(+)